MEVYVKVIKKDLLAIFTDKVTRRGERHFTLSCVNAWFLTNVWLRKKPALWGRTTAQDVSTLVQQLTGTPVVGGRNSNLDRLFKKLTDSASLCNVVDWLVKVAKEETTVEGFFDSAASCLLRAVNTSGTKVLQPAPRTGLVSAPPVSCRAACRASCPMLAHQPRVVTPAPPRTDPP